MNFDLNDVGVTFLVGAFSILSADAICFFLFRHHITQVSQRTLGLVPAAGPTAVLTTGVFVGLSFALGLLIEDASYKFHEPLLDRPSSTIYRVTHPKTADARSEDIKVDIERSVLFERLSHLSPTRTPLGDQVCRAGLFSLAFGTNGNKVQAWACADGPLPPPPRGKAAYYAVDRVIRSSFYFAKNRVFTVQSYYDELIKIQRRLEFSRTIATLTSAAAVIACIMWLGVMLREGLHRRHLTQLAKRGGLLVTMFVATYLLAYVAYVQESNEYVKRIFGYYAAMLHSAANHLP